MYIRSLQFVLGDGVYAVSDYCTRKYKLGSASPAVVRTERFVHGVLVEL